MTEEINNICMYILLQTLITQQKKYLKHIKIGVRYPLLKACSY